MQGRIQVQELGLWDLWGSGWHLWGFTKGDGWDLVLRRRLGRCEYWTRDEVFWNVFLCLEDKECFTGISDLHAEWNRAAIDGNVDLVGQHFDARLREERD